MTLNCLIVDDEPLALELLESYVSRTPFLHLVAKCDSAIQALSVVESEPVDLIFLDIQMPELNGLELSRLVGNKVKIIFTTAFEQYAIEGFRVDALDYLLKPFNYTEFLRAATKALHWIEMLKAEASTRPIPQSIFVKSDYKLVQVQLKDILYIEGLKDYIPHPDRGRTRHPYLMSMKSIEDFLPADIFIRVHRSYIVNVNKIKTIERNRIIFGKVYIPISDSYKERFTELLDKRAIN